MMILAFFAVFLLGLFQCFQQARLAWLARNSTGLTIFEKRAYKLKAAIAITLAFLAIIALFDAVNGVF